MSDKQQLLTDVLNHSLRRLHPLHRVVCSVRGALNHSPAQVIRRFLREWRAVVAGLVVGGLPCVGLAQTAGLSPDQQLQLDRGKAQLAAGQGERAYEFLEPLEDQLAGNVEYDFLLGQAALAAGHASRAAFAFERCLSVNPLQAFYLERMQGEPAALPADWDGVHTHFSK
ncbi:MAG: hypothetical protein GX772_00215 [Alcaligenaceae bacterium]|nr:hypothetical protein [Alcaligenaceae bacterium]